MLYQYVLCTMFIYISCTSMMYRCCCCIVNFLYVCKCTGDGFDSWKKILCVVMILISLETTEISCPFAKSSEFRGSLALRMKKAKDLTGFPNTSSFMHTLGRLYAAAILTPGVAERSIAGSIPTESTLFRRRSIHQHPSVRAVRLLPHRSRTGARECSLWLLGLQQGTCLPRGRIQQRLWLKTNLNHIYTN